jgi:hypothetical protein
MKRWHHKAALLGARLELREYSDGKWSCHLVPIDTPPEPILRPRTALEHAAFRDDAIRAALASYAAGGMYHRFGEPIFRTYAESSKLGG